jgi:hypothetical protein
VADVRVVVAGGLLGYPAELYADFDAVDPFPLLEESSAPAAAGMAMTAAMTRTPAPAWTRRTNRLPELCGNRIRIGRNRFGSPTHLIRAWQHGSARALDERCADEVTTGPDHRNEQRE